MYKKIYNMRKRISCWSPPPAGFFKVNADGARNPSYGLASSAAIAGDANVK